MYNTFLISAVLIHASVAYTTEAPNRGLYWAGIGIADITGPAADINMMGYADMTQITGGIHMRVFARAFIFADGPEKNRFVFVSADMCAISQLVKLDVVKQLRALYGDRYTEKNVILSATHTHSAPGGYFQYFLFQITSLGFIRESHDRYVWGIVEAIKKAHDNLKPAALYLKSGQVLNSQRNRSPTSYLKNPQAERDKYQSDTDNTMHMLRIDDALGNPIGMINWFSVHAVSMNKSNHLISGDNKGYASQMFERVMEPQSLAGRNNFVAAFAQSYEGDVSPNTVGARCLNTGSSCDLETSTCNGESRICAGVGPGNDMFESTKIIGENQLKAALEIFNSSTNSSRIKGPVRVAHQYVNMANVTVNLEGNQTAKTCIPALGYSFAAGATDGSSDAPFTQGTRTGNPIWDNVRDLLRAPPEDMVRCHHPKPILIPTGLMDIPYPWHPNIVDIQIARLGQLVILAVPGEFTTMAGRRLIEAVTKIFSDAGDSVQVVIAGLSNVYTQYVATPEEYSNQRYEGASTIYGPNTLPAYVQLYKELAVALKNDTTVPSGPEPPYLKDRLLTLVPPVIFDGSSFKRFGDIIRGPNPSHQQGDVVRVYFVGAHPRNSMGTEHRTFMTVDKMVTNGNVTNWKTIFTDAEWETRFLWWRDNIWAGTSQAILEWYIPSNMAEGTYRMCYYGHFKTLGIQPFSGCSPNFSVTKGR